jgi:hypothetical protein
MAVLLSKQNITKTGPQARGLQAAPQYIWDGPFTTDETLSIDTIGLAASAPAPSLESHLK